MSLIALTGFLAPVSAEWRTLPLVVKLDQMKLRKSQPGFSLYPCTTQRPPKGCSWYRLGSLEKVIESNTFGFSSLGLLTQGYRFRIGISS